jgi:hypothetical protein
MVVQQHRTPCQNNTRDHAHKLTSSWIQTLTEITLKRMATIGYLRLGAKGNIGMITRGITVEDANKMLDRAVRVWPISRPSTGLSTNEIRRLKLKFKTGSRPCANPAAVFA